MGWGVLACCPFLSIMLRSGLWMLSSVGCASLGTSCVAWDRPLVVPFLDSALLLALCVFPHLRQVFFGALSIVVLTLCVLRTGRGLCSLHVRRVGL